MVADTMTMRLYPTGDDPDFDAFLSFLNDETKTIPAPPKAAPAAEPISPSPSTTSSLSDDAFVIEVAKARPSLANPTPVVQKPKQVSATPAAKTKTKIMSASGTDTSIRTAATSSSGLSYGSYRTYNDLIKEKSTKNLKPPTAATPDSSYYGIFKGSGPTPPSMRNLDGSTVTKEASFKYYGIFDGQGPTPTSMGGDAEGKTSSTKSLKKEQSYKYFGVFEGSGPTPESQSHLENARAKSYNDIIREKNQAKLAEASLSADEPKEILYYGIFKGAGPAPGDEPTDPAETSSLKKEKSHKYYGLFEGAGPAPESQRHLVKEKPKSYNDLIREKSQANMKENGECLYYGVFKGM